MHINTRFNIVQAAGNCNPLFNVIDGDRTNSGHMAHGAKMLSGPALPRDKAIALADTLQGIHDTYMADLRIACELATPTDRREACDAAHADYEFRLEELGIALPA
jgi:hypothetical protein